MLCRAGKGGIQMIAEDEVYHLGQYEDTNEGERRDSVLIRPRHRTTGAAVDYAYQERGRNRSNGYARNTRPKGEEARGLAYPHAQQHKNSAAGSRGNRLNWRIRTKTNNNTLVKNTDQGGCRPPGPGATPGRFSSTPSPLRSRTASSSTSLLN